MWLILPTIVLVAVLWLAWAYLRFIRLQNALNQAWADLDAQLNRRFDLIALLISTIKRYTGSQQSLFNDIAAIRGTLSSDDAGVRSEGESRLTGLLANVLAMTETSADMNADQQLRAVKGDLTAVAHDILAAGKAYNTLVYSYNTLAQSANGKIIAAVFNFESSEADFQLQQHPSGLLV